MQVDRLEPGGDVNARHEPGADTTLRPEARNEGTVPTWDARLSAVLVDRPGHRVVWRDVATASSTLGGVLTVFSRGSVQYEAAVNASRLLVQTLVALKDAGQVVEDLDLDTGEWVYRLQPSDEMGTRASMMLADRQSAGSSETA